MVKAYYTCSEIALKYKVNIQTAWKWVRTGKLKAEKNPGEKEYRIYPEAIREFEKTLKVRT